MNTTWSIVKELANGEKEIQVREPWRLFVDGFRISAQDFYSTVETEFARRQMPGVVVTRDHWLEAGPLSDQREYLRVERGRFRFELCAAPFGSGFFFSLRHLYLPPTVNWWFVLLAGIALTFGFIEVVAFYGLLMAIAILLGGLLALVLALRTLGSSGLTGVERALVESSWVGGLYEILFRRKTRFSEDSQAAFDSLGEAIIKELTNQATRTKGVNIPHDALLPPINALFCRPGGTGKSESVAEA